MWAKVGLQILMLPKLQFMLLDEWMGLSFTSESITYSGVTVLNKKIYVSGGFDNEEKHPIRSVRYYDLGNDSWTSVANMTIGRFGHDLVQANGLLYAMGGLGCHVDEGNCYDLGSVDVHDPEEDTWTLGNQVEGEMSEISGQKSCVMMKYYLNL